MRMICFKDIILSLKKDIFHESSQFFLVLKLLLGLLQESIFSPRDLTPSLTSKWPLVFSCDRTLDSKALEETDSRKDSSGEAVRPVRSHVPSDISKSYSFTAILCLRMLLSQFGWSTIGWNNDWDGTSRFTRRVSFISDHLRSFITIKWPFYVKLTS